MLDPDSARLQIEEAYVPYYLHMLTYIRSRELVKYIYEQGGGVDRIYRMSSTGNMILEWTTRNEVIHKNLTIEVGDDGRFFLYLYSHKLEDLNIVQDGYLNRDTCIETLKKSIHYMLI